MFNWLKKNWSLTILLVIAFFYIKNTYMGRTGKLSLPITGGSYQDSSMGIASIPPSTSLDRLVITDTSLSLQVKDVSQSINLIQQETQKLGGFLVNSHLSKPEFAASGNITIRIPSNNLPQALEVFRTLAVKVVSESVVGTDVTDQYEDLGARLDVLNKTKAKFESIMDQAVKVPDLLEVQRELVSLQSQIDNVIGQQQYYKKSADLSKVVIYLSTDDLSLPYAPTGQWRPIMVFKTAIRSMLATLRVLVGLVIWLAIYSPIIILALFVYKRLKKHLMPTFKT